jgi:hypothetical protein
MRPMVVAFDELRAGFWASPPTLELRRIALRSNPVIAPKESGQAGIIRAGC